MTDFLKNGAKNFLGKAQNAWQTPAEAAIRDPNVTLQVNLKGLGSFTDSATDGLASPGEWATDTEMGWIAKAVAQGYRTWGSVKFWLPDASVDGGWRIENVPEPDWSTMPGANEPFKFDRDPFCGCSSESGSP